MTAAPTLQTAAPLAKQSLQTTNRTARELAGFAIKGEMDLSPAFQRASTWTELQQQNLVKSWLLGIPIPNVIINARWSSGWPQEEGDYLYAVIDGKQRIEAAVAWFTGKLAVPASWFPDEDLASTIDTADGPYVTYDRLTRPGQWGLDTWATLPMAESRVKTIEEEAAIYNLVNTGGTPQTDADLANARFVAAGTR